jgi:hypothetical protein
MNLTPTGSLKPYEVSEKKYNSSFSRSSRLLPRAGHADARASRSERASRAPWRGRMTKRLPERDEQAVVLDPVAARQDFAQRNFGLVGGDSGD